MRSFFLILLLLASSFFCKAQTSTKRLAAFPLAVAEQNSLMASWEKKAVLDAKLIDDMEAKGKWIVISIGQMSYTRDRAKDGKQSLRFRTSIRDTAYLALPGNKTKWGSQMFNINGQAGASSLQLHFDTPQDWSGYNRISFWIYLHPTAKASLLALRAQRSLSC